MIRVLKISFGCPGEFDFIEANCDLDSLVGDLLWIINQFYSSLLMDSPKYAHIFQNVIRVAIDDGDGPVWFPDPELPKSILRMPKVGGLRDDD